MEVKKEFKNDLLKRKEVLVSNVYSSNPGLSQSLKDVASKFKVSEDVIVLRRVGNEFGNNEFIIDAFIYDSLEDKEKVEPKKKEKKK